MSKQDNIQRLLSLIQKQNPAAVITQKFVDELEAKKDSEITVLLNMAHTPYTLKLHERYWNKDIQMDILRVPGGWFYSTYCMAETFFCPFEKLK